MKINFRRRTIETVCTFLAYYLLLFSLFLFVFYQADRVFDWDIIPAEIQRVIESFIIPSVTGIIVFAIVISVVINLSLISLNIEKIADKTNAEESNRTEIRVEKKTKRTFLLTVLVLFLFLLGFQLWDKWETSSRKKEFENTFITKQNLFPFDSLVSILNMNDTLRYKINVRNEVNLDYDSCLGKSNVQTYKSILNQIDSFEANFLAHDRRSSLQFDFIINFNNVWVGSLHTGSYVYWNYEATRFKNLNKNNLLNLLFKNNLNDVLVDYKDGYEIYYKINDSRSFKFVIFLTGKTMSVLNCDYHVFR